MGSFTDFRIVVSPLRAFTVYVKFISERVLPIRFFFGIKQFYRVIIGIPDYQEQIVKIMSFKFIGKSF